MFDLSNPAVVRRLLTRHGFTFSKALGQNFLINPSVCPRMAELSGADKDSCALEVGPGFGVLTAELAARAKKVTAIELDKRLLPVLSETLAGCENVNIINDDVMKADLRGIIEHDFCGCRTVVCANLPYYITSPVIMYLLESRLPIDCITVMVQKEAARRLCAAPGSKDAGAVSCAVSYYAQPKLLFNVSSGSFMPAPKVDSSVIRLDIRQNPAVNVKDEALMFRAVRAAFNQRRKTIHNALAAGLSLPKETVAGALEAAHIPLNIRGERLSLEDFARLADKLAEI